MSSLLRTHAHAIALTLFLLLLTLAAGTALLGLAGHFLTAAALAGVAAMGFNFFAPSAGIRALTFVRILSRYAEKLVGHDVTLKLARDLRVGFFRSVLPLAPLGLGRHRVGDLLSRLVADIENVDGLLVRALGPLLALAALAFGAVLVTAWLLPVAGLLLALVLLAVGVGIPATVSWRASQVETRRTDARAALRISVLEAMEGATDLAAMEANMRWMEHVDANTAAVAACERERKQSLALGIALHGVVVALSLPLMLWFLLEAATTGHLTPAAAGGLFFMTLAVYEAAAGVNLAWQSLQATRVSWRRLQAVSSQKPLVQDPVHAQNVPAIGTLEFTGVGFHWPGEPRQVLNDLDLVITPGQRIALHGDSGAGKSSLVALALRLCDPQQGTVRYGGLDLRDFTQEQWHQHIAWLPQEAPVFAGSVRDNLCLGAPLANDTDLWEVLAQVRMEATIRALPDGLDAWIGENGATLSTGQSRRIALSRALLRNAPILLLDEPCEGLDIDTANELLLDLASASGSRTLLMISHDDLPPGVVHARYRLIEGQLLAD